MLIILTCLLTLALGYYGWIKNLNETIAKERRTGQELKNQETQLLATQKNLAYPEKTKPWTMPQLLAAFANFNQVKFESVKPLPAVNKDNVLLMPVQMDLLGDYHVLLQFISAMLQTPYSFSLTTLTIEKQQNTVLRMMATINLK